MEKIVSDVIKIIKGSKNEIEMEDVYKRQRQGFLLIFGMSLVS